MHDQDPKPVSASDAQPSAPTPSQSPRSEVRSLPPAQSREPEAENREPEPWIPESKLPPLPKSPINSIVRNILLTNPMFPIFYADVILDSAPNSHEAKILAANYQKILDRISMPTTCTHIKVTGVRCGSPTLRGEQFCYFHQHAHRGVRKPPQSRLHPIAIIEDEESIQASLMEVINALMRDTIDVKRAALILRALHIAVKNASRVMFATASKMVKDIPDYEAPTKDHVGTAAPGTCGDGAMPRPGGPDVPGRSPATEPDMPYSAQVPPYPTREHQREIQQAAKAQVERDRIEGVRARLTRASKERQPDEQVRSSRPTQQPVPPHDFKKQNANEVVTKRNLPLSSSGGNPNANPSVREPNKKPSQSASPEAPKERKNAAHRVSGG